MTLERTDPDRVKARLAEMERIEEEIYQASTQIVAATLEASCVPPNLEEPPPEWVEKYGLEGAKMRLIVAKHAWLPKNQAPMFMHTAQDMSIGIQRIRALRAGTALALKELNVKIALPAPTSAEHPGPVEYETREIE